MSSMCFPGRVLSIVFFLRTSYCFPDENKTHSIPTPDPGQPWNCLHILTTSGYVWLTWVYLDRRPNPIVKDIFLTEVVIRDSRNLFFFDPLLHLIENLCPVIVHPYLWLTRVSSWGKVHLFLKRILILTRSLTWGPPCTVISTSSSSTSSYPVTELVKFLVHTSSDFFKTHSRLYFFSTNQKTCQSCWDPVIKSYKTIYTLCIPVHSEGTYGLTTCCSLEPWSRWNYSFLHGLRPGVAYRS
jgi:hypothetical protein